MTKKDFLRNRFILNQQYCQKRTYLSRYPVEMTIELTNRCNLNCIICPYSKMKRTKGLMEFSLFRKIIDEVAGKVESIELDLLGESTMHPEIGKMINYCKRAGLFTLLNSNMTIVDSKLAQSLIDSGLDMIVMSMDGADKDTYQSIRRGACFDKTTKNIETLLSLNPKGLCRVVQMVYTTVNKSQGRQLLKVWRNKGADFVRFRLYQNVDKQQTELNAIPATVRTSKEPCVQPWKKLAICWDGTAVLCCLDYDKFRVVGDAKKQGIFEIWNSDPMQESRRILIDNNLNKLSLCKDCFPFQPNKAVLWGSILLNPIQVRKLMFIFEKLKVFYRISFFRYF